MSLLTRVKDLAFNPEHTRWMTPLLLIADAALCGAVIEKIPYTEIDWTTYMQQIAIYLKGERDYAKISGDTGPLVYPGAHVWIYRYLYAWTDEGKNIALAQYIFALVYLLTLAVVIQCYRRARVPPYIFPLLILSKRLHSIFVLRCFNDCFAALFFWLAIYCYQRNQWHIGSALYSTGLNVKMTLLLPLPAIGIIMVMKLGGREALTQAMIIGQVAILFGYPFRKRSLSYFPAAFNFGRSFLYKWTVNWRFVPESVFLSKPFALGLLALNIGLLFVFMLTRWIKPSKRSFRGFLKLCVPTIEPRDQDTMASKITPDFTTTTILTGMTVGLLCARSLHYQFYAYIAWCTPFLLWKAGFNPIAVYALWGAQEWAWNVYPSTPLSSATAVGVLAITVAGVWWGTRKEYEGVTKGVIEDDHPHKE
ncbi:Lethal 2 neighbour of Tid protein [Pyrenophora tritici-repentis]|uniref:Dol-P-Man:Man(5)GlcNAc(2)-PP-Dol alpha-1,3-mannosyltransferase n=3 Tax=Pyrenophora tritici-repentis TaxID=45151 RepID=A0A2W1G7G4_9PLEO|nr:Lethal(2)neighbour of Tid protein [Pyrenophora tritici-repentis Pt-1C-BFP]KAF7442217.1 Lethalneighbour of Tid protein [Pyrenophora tritici-repentis]EDU42205.1 Lethal(2)neighbour of Tid protein [Pyrenophora tritici-repentis Pt-1C-BFP]KAI0578793.1 Lethal(2)neighbour of Tid protein [Pyrenophora tritici-repentis]KAI0580384.1 Lethal(2)neighbour of Tid protein [Pyrenophora tritici-repentis]KAI0610676.1 Lethal(2)neighbour of Tid protein [Pyrenophora tritici-repentis]